VQHNLDACFNNQYVCVTHHEDSTNQPQHDTDKFYVLCLPMILTFAPQEERNPH
jgi:hypothetical protein